MAGRVLQGGIECGGQRGQWPFPPLDIGVPDIAILVTHGAARHRHLAKIEAPASTTGPAAQHHQAVFRAAQHDMGRKRCNIGKQRGQLRQLGAGQNRHPALAGRNKRIGQSALRICIDI